MSITLLRIQTFLKSLFWHVWAGFPKSTQEQIDYRLNICLSCDKYDATNKECSICGCNVNNKRIFMNKLAWADQHCPLDKWPKIS
jgi:uncharacterized paraquat-inducible protein A